MKARLLTRDDYNELKSWWASWDWPAIPKEFLPENGVLVYNDDYNICAAWLYKTDVPICWAEHFISNKEATKQDRQDGLIMLLDELNILAKDMGFKVVMTSMKGRIMESKLKQNGYVSSDKNMSHYIRAL